MATIWQNAPSISLEIGCYEGLTPVSELKRHGDLGLGAFDELDGEMVGVDGVFYRVLADASAHAAPDSAEVAWCMVTKFGGAESFPLPSDVTHDSLPAVADARLGNANLYFSLRVDGRFRALCNRSLGRQSKPFRPLAEIEETHPMYEYEDAEGTMVGFRTPSYVGRVSPPGYHFHFISADRTFGGHVESFTVADARLTFEPVDRLDLAFPTVGDFPEKDLGLSE